MGELVARSPCDGLLPVRAGAYELAEEPFAPITSLMPFRGRDADLSAALETAFGVTLPGINSTASKAGVSVQWFGHGQFLLIGAAPVSALAGLAALSDQSDGWARVRLTGPAPDTVLARLVPVDLRMTAFHVGSTLRAPLMHMMSAITRVSADTIQIMVFRSMAATLVHDLQRAMEAVAARG